MMTNVPQFVPQEVCLSCKGCCRFDAPDSAWRPKTGPEETSDKRGLVHEIFSKKLDKKGYIKTISCHGQNQCAFFHAPDNICHIYERRPFECRLYPFLLIKRGDGIAVGAHLSCPHIKATGGSAGYHEFVESLRRHFQKADVLDFLRRNLMLFGDYRGYEEEIEFVFAVDL